MDGTKDGIRELRLSSASRNQDDAVISVMDTGPGTDPEKRDSIFDAFVTTKPRGMGLGLAISRDDCRASRRATCSLVRPGWWGSVSNDTADRLTD